MILASVAVLAADENKNPLVPAGGEIVIGVIAFGFLCFVLMKFAFPRAEELYQQRHDTIEGGIARAERAQGEAQRTLEQYRAQLADARGEANRIREEAREQGRAIVAELRERGEREAAEIRTRADAQIAASRQQAVAELRRDVGQIALDLAAKIVGTSLESDAQQRRLVDDFIAGLESDEHAVLGGGDATPATAGAGGGDGVPRLSKQS